MQDSWQPVSRRVDVSNLLKDYNEVKNTTHVGLGLVLQSDTIVSCVSLIECESFSSGVSLLRPHYLACASNDGIPWNSQYGAPLADSADAYPRGLDSVVNVYILLSMVNYACRAYQIRCCFRIQTAALADDGSGDKNSFHSLRAGVTRPNIVLVFAVHVKYAVVGFIYHYHVDIVDQ